MTRSLVAIWGISLFFLVVISLPTHAQEKPTTEEAKIEALLQRVEGIKDAQFIRNGKEYNAKTAAKYLRAKWKANAAKVQTAKDFIEKVASFSSTTGKAYLIRFKDGKEINNADYLFSELKKLESSSIEKRAP